MECIVGKLEKTSIDIVLDIDDVKIRPATSWEQKYGYKPDIYILIRTDQKQPIYCMNADAAWVHANAALVAEKCKYFGFELDGKWFVYKPEKCRFVLDCVMNPDIDRYRVEFTVDDTHFVLCCSTFATAKIRADEEYGIVRDMNGHFIYAKKEPDAYSEFWDL